MSAESFRSSNNVFTSFFYLFFPKSVFPQSFWKCFFVLFFSMLLAYAFEYLRFSRFDQELFSYRHSVMVLFSLCEFAFCISLAYLIYGFRRLYPILCIPLFLIAMDYSNGVIQIKFDFYRTIYYSTFMGSLLIILDLLAYSFRFRFLSLLRTFLFSVLFLISLLMIGNRVFSGSGINQDAMMAIQQTDIREAYYFFFGLNNGALLLIWLVLCFAALGYIVFYIFASDKKIPLSKGEKEKVNRAVSYSALLLLPSIVLGYVANMEDGPHLYSILSFPVQYSRYLNEFKSMKEERKVKLQNMVFANNSGNGFDGKYVLVIGETLNRNYMGCYGYQKNTTPFQTEARESDNFIFFKHCFSCHVQTLRVIPMLLMDQNQYNGKDIDFLNSISIIDIAKASGYHTAWISGQERISNNNSMISVIAEESDYIVFQDPKSETALRDNNSVLLLDNVLDEDRSLTIVHLFGCHYPYSLDYPSDMKFDDPTFSMYEKAVFYNDLIMARMIETAKKKDVDVLMYLSDHSESLSPPKRARRHDSRRYTQEMTEIPWWIYVSDKYKEEHPDIIKQLEVASTQIVTNDLVFDLMVLIMGVNNSFVDPALTPGDESYRIDAQSVRTLYGEKKIIIKE